MTNFKIPFSLTASGAVNTTDDPNQIANDRVESLVATYPGERVMLPTYGVNLPAYVFAPDLVANQAVLINQIKQSVAKWEPTIVLNSVTPVVQQQDVGLVDINIEFTMSNNPAVTPVQTATVEVGGKVVNN